MATAFTDYDQLQQQVVVKMLVPDPVPQADVAPPLARRLLIPWWVRVVRTS